jgi:diguanylate cyclase (GGDEF)-like protein
MDDRILKSVIGITRQRDIDSLERSLVSTLAEFVPLSSISIYKLPHLHEAGTVEETVRLSITEQDDSGKNHSWSNGKQKVTANRHLNRCLQSVSIVRYEDEDGTTHQYYPVTLEHKISGALVLASRQPLDPWHTLVEALVSIYNNYLAILNESERDKLTSLLNRRTFDFKLDRLLEEQRAIQETYKSSGRIPEQRHPDPAYSAWLAMIDIDNFKRINDTYGHLFGDEVILMLSQKMRGFFRNTDLLFRFGGEEFVVVLEPTSPEMAKRTFERFSRMIADHEFPQVGKTSVSTGYARIMENDYPHAILERADKALYYAKESGKNRVCNFDELVANGLLSRRKDPGSTVLFDS